MEENISDIASYLRISRPSATVLIKKLDKYGFVRKHPEPGNERQTIVSLTKKGRLFPCRIPEALQEAPHRGDM